MPNLEDIRMNHSGNKKNINNIPKLKTFLALSYLFKKNDSVLETAQRIGKY